MNRPAVGVATCALPACRLPPAASCCRLPAPLCTLTYIGLRSCIAPVMNMHKCAVRVTLSQSLRRLLAAAAAAASTQAPRPPQSVCWVCFLSHPALLPQLPVALGFSSRCRGWAACGPAPS